MTGVNEMEQDNRKLQMVARDVPILVSDGVITLIENIVVSRY